MIPPAAAMWAVMFCSLYRHGTEGNTNKVLEPGVSGHAQLSMPWLVYGVARSCTHSETSETRHHARTFPIGFNPSFPHREPLPLLLRFRMDGYLHWTAM